MFVAELSVLVLLLSEGMSIWIAKKLLTNEDHHVVVSGYVKDAIDYRRLTFGSDS